MARNPVDTLMSAEDAASVRYHILRVKTVMVACERLVTVRRLQATASGQRLAALEAEEDALGPLVVAATRAGSAADPDLFLLEAHLAVLERHGD